MAGYQLAMDYRTPFTTTTLTLANVDFLSKSGKFVIKSPRGDQ